ncbi:hypothetical protein E1B28_006461 [Marasmius oreades]|uniref:Uncharacterized protein n=1 Tax=Marasmius oreades TaxID=181124 RepID=A0A9P7S7I0_9AGAR|nr:uncharacterized protein E1B28_006461 [Marasmius oreades]KAG7095751.1 hypothetical protein E1B28_006461 [Marasmius oreades]
MIAVHTAVAEDHDDPKPLWIRDSTTRTTTSIYQLFKELVPNSSGEQPPCDGCGSGEEIEVRGEPVVQEFSTYVVDQCIIDLFRAKMASLRYREVEIPQSADSISSFELKYIIPVAEVFRRHVFCEEKGFSSSDFGYKKSTWPPKTQDRNRALSTLPLLSPSRGELFTFQYYPLEPAAEPKPLASVIVLPTGSVCWNDFQRLFREESDKWFTCRKNLPLLERLDDFWHSAESYIVLTDEFNVEIIHNFSHIASSLGICGWSAPLSDNLTLNCAIGAALDNATPWRYRYGAMSPIYHVQGALNCTDPSLPTSPIAMNECPTCFLDFDLFTMQRHPPDFDSFLDWKESIEEEVLSQPLNVGDELIICPDGFIKRSSLLPCFLPLEKPSSSTLEAIMKRPRSRHVDVDHILTQVEHFTSLSLRSSDLGSTNFPK